MIEDRLCEQYVSEWFGPIVGKVAGLLASRGPLTLPHLVQLSKGTLTGRQAKDALFILLHHSLLKWNTSAALSIPEYRVDKKRIHFIIGCFGWLLRAVQSSGLSSDIIESFKEVAVMGMVPLEGKFEALLANKLVEPVTSLTDKPTVEEDYIPQAKRVRHDDTVFVRLSVPGLTELWQSQVLYEFVKNTLNESAAKICKQLYFTPSTAHTIAMQFGKELKVDYSFCKPDGRSNAFHYLETLCNRYKFVIRRSTITPNDRQTTVTYMIDRQAFITCLQNAVYLSLLSRRFGRPTARIVKFVMENGPQEDRILSERLLMTAKEVRERLYQLLALSLIHIQEIPKSADHAPSRTVFLWSCRCDLVWAHLRERQMYAISTLTRSSHSEHEQSAKDSIMAKREAVMLEHFIFSLD